MSKTLITQYYSRLDKLIQFGGSRKEMSVRNEFYNLLNSYAEKKNLVLVAELPVQGTKGKDVTPDGTLKNVLRLEYGYWESKDESLDLNEEIDKKIKKGYPLNNILFEDSQRAILIQGGEEVMDINMRKPDELDRILTAFINFKSPLVKKYEEAIVQFQIDIPIILETLRDKINEARDTHPEYKIARDAFLELCRAEINPDVTVEDVREMMIQHILTSDIFNKIFDDAEFHRHNNIASELEKLVETLFNYNERRNLLGSIEHYYDAINAAAASVVDHHEKQKFLKALYENFYKAYNPKAADRLGVVYTPNEIVDFMVDSTNYLLEKHFKRVLWDKNVEILDPATGTGTFICSIIDKCPNQYLAHKYKNELHANDVAILPYYVANLNIEYTFKQKMGYFEEFPNICFVDTLDNTGALTYHGKQESLFGLSSENAERIKKQNQKKISVIIGNPPYNAKQENYNYQNSNRAYSSIDERIKNTYIKYGTAQNQIVLYDMYTRFIRWATDRIGKDGILAFVSNNSFIDSMAFDGFRKDIADEFSEIWIVNLKGNARTSGERRRKEAGNIFSDLIRVGVCVYFLVKKESKTKLKVFYNEIGDYVNSIGKKDYLKSKDLTQLTFEQITPDDKHNWINQSDNDFDELLPLIDKNVKAGKSEKAVFKLFANGLETGRDEWLFDFSDTELLKKVGFYINTYNESVKKGETINLIKWNRDLKNLFTRKILVKYNDEKLRYAHFRPFQKLFFYADIELNYLLTLFHFEFFGSKLNKDNKVIATTGTGFNQPFHCLAFSTLTERHTVEKSQCLPLYRYDKEGKKFENITDWGLTQFTTHYKDTDISKEDIFHYVYGVLHNPAYRKKYEINLKREFPRIPFYEDFGQWANWGKKLMGLHLNYETIAPFPLEEHNHETKAEAKRQKEMFTIAKEPEAMFVKKPKIKVKLKANKQDGIIEIDELTFLTGVPREAWDYKLGNRSAIEWILNQYKEKKPRDPTIAEKFNTYRFADYKEHVIDLIKRVCTVSVETMKVIGEMQEVKS